MMSCVRADCYWLSQCNYLWSFLCQRWLVPAAFMQAGMKQQTLHLSCEPLPEVECYLTSRFPPASTSEHRSGLARRGLFVGKPGLFLYPASPKQLPLKAHCTSACWTCYVSHATLSVSRALLITRKLR